MTQRSRSRKLRKKLKNKENTDVRPYTFKRPPVSGGIKGLRPRLVTIDEWTGPEAEAPGEPSGAGGDHDSSEGGRGDQSEARVVRPEPQRQEAASEGDEAEPATPAHWHFFEREVNGLPEYYARSTCFCSLGDNHWTNTGEN